MKSKTKSEIAQAADINTKVLRRWMMEHRRDSSAMGDRPTRRQQPKKEKSYMCREQALEDNNY